MADTNKYTPDISSWFFWDESAGVNSDDSDDSDKDSEWREAVMSSLGPGGSGDAK